jgi:hypothetical protein
VKLMEHVERDHVDVLKPFHRSVYSFVEEAIMTFHVNTSELAVIELITSVANLIRWPARFTRKIF